MTFQQVNIGEVIVNGVVFDPKNLAMVRVMNVDNLLASVSQLFDLLEERNVDYVLVGGIAMLTYVSGRNTQDIDLILSSDALTNIPEIQIEEQTREFGRGRFGDLQVDMLFTANTLFDHVRRQRVVDQAFVDRSIPCATVEGLVLLKLFALPSLYRQGRFDRVRINESDVAALTDKYHPEMAPLYDELAKHLSQADLGEIREIVEQIEQRLVESRKRFGGDA